MALKFCQVYITFSPLISKENSPHLFAGRGASEESSDYSLLVACFAGGLTAVCILVVGITLTLYRRNHFMQPMKTQTHIVHYESNNEDYNSVSPIQKSSTRREEKNSLNIVELRNNKDQHDTEPPDDDPDVIPNKIVERRPDIFQPNYTSTPERIKQLEKSEIFDYSTSMNLVDSGMTTTTTTTESWIFPHGYRERAEELSPVRPTTLPVHRSHDIYTRSLRVQESCI